MFATLRLLEIAVSRLSYNTFVHELCIRFSNYFRSRSIRPIISFFDHGVKNVGDQISKVSLLLLDCYLIVYMGSKQFFCVGFE